MQNFIEILKRETETLKIQYIEMTEKYAIDEFNYLRQWVSDYQDGKFRFADASKKYYKLPYHIVNPNGKVEQHIEQQVKAAYKHYDSSIEKLAEKIEKYDLNMENLKIVTSHIGVNIETTITDGSKTINAFTIIASGPTQRPHYRYLIKYNGI